MQYDFWQILILILIALLFAKEIFGDWVRQKFGISPKENGVRNTFSDGEWRGEVSTSLKFMQKDIGEIKEDGKAMRKRLSEHLDDEESKLDTINERLLKLEK